MPVQPVQPVQCQCICRFCIKQQLLQQITSEFLSWSSFHCRKKSLPVKKENLECLQMLLNISTFLTSVLGPKLMQLYYSCMGILCCWYVWYGWPAGTIRSQSAILGYPPTHPCIFCKQCDTIVISEQKFKKHMKTEPEAVSNIRIPTPAARLH